MVVFPYVSDSSIRPELATALFAILSLNFNVCKHVIINHEKYFDVVLPGCPNSPNRDLNVPSGLLSQQLLCLNEWDFGPPP